MRECSQSLSLAHRFRARNIIRLPASARSKQTINCWSARTIRPAVEAYEELCRGDPRHATAHGAASTLDAGRNLQRGLGRGEGRKRQARHRSGQGSDGHLIQILAHWNESSEAEFIRRNLRWTKNPEPIASSTSPASTKPPPKPSSERQSDSPTGQARGGLYDRESQPAVAVNLIHPRDKPAGVWL